MVETLGEMNCIKIAFVSVRLLTKDARIIPGYGVQYATLIGSEQFKTLTQVIGVDDLDLSSFNRFRDSCSLIFSKNYGVLFQNLDISELTPPIVNFHPFQMFTVHA